MKKLSLLALAFALLVGGTLVPPPATAAAAAPQGAQLVSTAIARMERNRQSLKSLRANVLIQKVDARFGEEMSRGSVQYVPGSSRNNANVRLDFSSPREEVLAVKDGQYTYYKKRANTAYKGRSNNAPKGGSLLSFAFASGAQLRSDFNVEYMGDGTLEAGGAHVTWLKLVPKGGADFKFAEIWVDDSGMPVQTRITERNGDSTLVRLSGIQRNAKIAPSAFDISLPSSVKVINS